jgi:hypothetical protein
MAQGPAQGGEKNTASNVGTGTGVFKQKSGTDLQFRSVKGLNDLSVGLNGDDIELNAKGRLASSTITATSGNLAVNTSHIVNNAARVTLLLPSASAVGDVIEIVGYGAGGWRLQPNTGQSLHIGGRTITNPTYLDSLIGKEVIRLVCTVTNLEWEVVNQHALNAVNFVYGGTVLGANPPAGTILAEGYCPAQTHNGIQFVNGQPGVIATRLGATGTKYLWALLGGTDYYTSGVLYARAIELRGTKTYIKGHYQAIADAPFDNAFERFAVGFVYPSSQLDNAASYMANETDTTRYNVSGTYLVVTDAESIKTVNNNSSTSGTTYNTPTGSPTLDLSAGFDFEIVLEVPSTATALADLRVTISINGTKYLDNAVPAFNGAPSSYTPWPVLLLNQNGIVTNLVFKVEKAA